MCAAYLGMTPAQVDECSFRDVYVMLAGAVKHTRQQAELSWQQTLAVAQAIENTMRLQAGKKPRPLDYMFKQVKKPRITLDEYRKRRDAALEIIHGNGS